MISVEWSCLEIWNLATGSVSRRLHDCGEPHGGIAGCVSTDGLLGLVGLDSFLPMVDDNDTNDIKQFLLQVYLVCLQDSLFRCGQIKQMIDFQIHLFCHNVLCLQ